jgi:hypothetical protein
MGKANAKPGGKRGKIKDLRAKKADRVKGGVLLSSPSGEGKLGIQPLSLQPPQEGPLR